jgi:hypothetical protein
MICTIPLYVCMFSYMIPRLCMDGSGVVWNVSSEDILVSQ